MAYITNYNFRRITKEFEIPKNKDYKFVLPTVSLSSILIIPGNYVPLQSKQGKQIKIKQATHEIQGRDQRKLYHG